jgi:hypothetical protein
MWSWPRPRGLASRIEAAGLEISYCWPLHSDNRFLNLKIGITFVLAPAASIPKCNKEMEVSKVSEVEVAVIHFH